MRCNKCGNTNGFYKKLYISVFGVQYHNGDGTYSEENGQIYDYLNHKVFKTCYCKECNKRLTKKELEVEVSQ